MCNVHFIYPLGGKIVKEDIVTMNRLLESGGDSNKDAYGVSNGKETITFKGEYNKKEAEAFSTFVGSEFIIGHNRLATQGETQQPIIHKGIAMAHNGVLYNYFEKDSKEKKKRKKR